MSFLRRKFQIGESVEFMKIAMTGEVQTMEGIVEGIGFGPSEPVYYVHVDNEDEDGEDELYTLRESELSA
jgi:hypothetical protein